METHNMVPAVETRRRDAGSYDFRRIHPQLQFGTASDRYAGWIGQIYPASYEAEVKTRRKKLGQQTFEERTLPVSSAQEYFEHFSILEIDFTFYRPLLDLEGKPTNNFFVLEQYAAHAPDHARFILKAPQSFFARTVRRRSGGQTRLEDNPEFLNAEWYRQTFHEPALGILGSRLAGILFQQEYQRVKDSPDPEQNIAEFDRFFADIPHGVQPHIELRSSHLLVPPYFAWLESCGIGFAFSHWTWLPSIQEQWRRAGEQFSAADGQAFIRLLTPRNVPYAEAYATAYPFDKPVPELVASKQTRQMIDEVTALAFQAIEKGVTLNVIANNRAYGNSPALAQALTYRFLDFAEKRGV